MNIQNQVSTDSEKKIIQIDDARVKNHLDDIVRGTVEETLNSMLDAEASALCQAEKHERTGARKDYRSGYYTRNLETKTVSGSNAVGAVRYATWPCLWPSA